MAQPYVSGPVHLYVGVSGSPVYLGTFIEAPKVRTTPKFSPVFNDLAGDQEPFDMQYQGSSADVFGDLTVFNWTVLRSCQTRRSLNSNEGSDAFGATGALMIGEGLAYPLWLHYPYYQLKAAFSNNGAPPGYHYVASWLIGPDEEDLGTKANQVHVQFHAMRAYVPAAGGFILFDRNMIGIPAVPPTGSAGV